MARAQSCKKQEPALDLQPHSLYAKCMINVVVLSLLTGLAVGILFTALKLPLPAPNAFAGVMGIVGIYLGSLAWPMISKLFS